MSVKSLLFLSLMLTSLAWTFMTPISGVADEDQYSVYANVVASGQGYGDAKIPTYLADLESINCHKRKQEETANCPNANYWNNSGDKLVKVKSAEMINGYPYPYFWIVGQPSRILSGFEALYGMRIFAWAMACLVVGLAVMNWPNSHTRTMVLGFMAVFTPMVASTSGAVNPNGFEILAGLSLSALLGSVLLKGKGDEISNSHRVSIVFVSLALSTTKPWSFFLTALIYTAFLALTFVPKKLSFTSKSLNLQNLISLRDKCFYLAVLSISVTTGWISNALYREVMAERGTEELVLPFWYAVRIFLGSFTTFQKEFIGIFGWRDHAPQEFVLMLWLSAIVFALIYTMRNLRSLSNLFLISYLSIAFVALPIVSLEVLGLLGGAGYQGRYAGALFTGVIFLCIVLLDINGRNPESLVSNELLLWVISGFVALNASSLIWSFHRYSVGFPLAWERFPFEYEWAPDYWYIALLALASSFAFSFKLAKIITKSTRNVIEQ
jgi:hypothetical protein